MCITCRFDRGLKRCVAGRTLAEALDMRGGTELDIDGSMYPSCEDWGRPISRDGVGRRTLANWKLALGGLFASLGICGTLSPELLHATAAIFSSQPVVSSHLMAFRSGISRPQSVSSKVGVDKSELSMSPMAHAWRQSTPSGTREALPGLVCKENMLKRSSEQPATHDFLAKRWRPARAHSNSGGSPFDSSMYSEPLSACCVRT